MVDWGETVTGTWLGHATSCLVWCDILPCVRSPNLCGDHACSNCNCAQWTAPGNTLHSALSTTHSSRSSGIPEATTGLPHTAQMSAPNTPIKNCGGAWPSEAKQQGKEMPTGPGPTAETRVQQHSLLFLEFKWTSPPIWTIKQCGVNIILYCLIVMQVGANSPRLPTL